VKRRFSFGAHEWPGIAKLNEECGEVVQVIGKMMNVEPDFDIDVDTHWDGANLRDALTEEMADVLAAIAFVVEHSHLDEELIAARVKKKRSLFEMWHVEQSDH